MTEKQEETCECGFYKKFHKQIFRDVVELTDLPKSPCKKFTPTAAGSGKPAEKNHSPQVFNAREPPEGTQNQEEFNLSDKLQKFEGWHSKENRFIHISHVKIFIKNNKLKSLKAKHCNPETLVIPLDWFLNEAGEELSK